MTKEEKDLVFKDLCARLPYKPKVHVEHDVFYDEREPYDTVLDSVNTFANLLRNGIELKPYLRPLSSMTDDEFDELTDIVIPIDNGKSIVEEKKIEKYIKFMYSHNFDYRGLVDKGLAIETKNN
jgi:hypothetical protein